ncbi:hypothetical protein EHQ12_02895 [Leptospira gomenensis]|uniref:Uncharacterized protein n=1 Tax=Leptospira gomenensis TaxID=2484974 RepID=A0A5F1Z0E3_9LEPT|nr:hypothetical protein [Leptospira gomenensis]TGK31008.1 hypothetical protein EHQ17_14930 [Leptospira gomenensis]TGK43214.1 hypothetical protein EHQ12_02895 [Leptospira gomenensis]TGK45272.1 hypothetical protein EHQ07_10070 [Leptospira gomenensis]TGK66186.1 hypothetical protein EHQ13_03805 [Leptospira gomenensis]
MNSKSLKHKLVGFFLPITFFANCIAYSENLLQKPAPLDTTKIGYTKPKVFLKTAFQVFLSGAATPAHPLFQENWNKALQNKIKTVGIFADITENESTADYRLEVIVEDRGEANVALAVLTGLTLFLFPSTASDHFKVTLNVADKKGNKLGTVVKEEKIVLWQQILLLFGLPFFYPPSVAKQAQEDLITAIFVEAYHQGYFSKDKPKKK